MEDHATQTPHVVVAGGGIAGLEAVLALRHLAGERIRVTLVSAEPEFTYLPQLVEEPFTMQPALRRELAGAMQELKGDFVLGQIDAVDVDAHRLALADGQVLHYSNLLVCLGGRRRPAYENVTTLHGPQFGVDIDSLLSEVAADEVAKMALIVPPGVAWALPLYEFALMTRRRAEELGLRVSIEIFTAETAPLGVFGVEGSAQVAEHLRARDIHVTTQTRVAQETSGELYLRPGGRRIHCSRAVALPVIDGPAIVGLPADADGFIPTDPFGRVRGVKDVYAAGDGTTFPVKQGGIACAQADAAAEHIAMTCGSPIQARAFRPVLRGKLLTGGDSMFLRHEPGGGDGEGAASRDPLWQPAIKVGGRYLAPWLQNEREPEPVELDAQVGAGEPHRPRAWHDVPMALDPL